MEGSLSNADFSGFLYKQGHAFNTDFKRRFFVLRGTKLAYFEDRAAATKGKSKGIVTVTRVRHLRRGEGGASFDPMRLPLAFHFDTAERKPFIVYADDMQAKLDWLRSLLAVIRRAAHSGAFASAAVEDVYREQVSAVEAGAPSSLEAAAWAAVAKGCAAARAGQHDAAHSAYTEALKEAGHEKRTTKEPVVLAALYELGKLLCERQDYAGAFSYFEQVLNVVPPDKANQV